MLRVDQRLQVELVVLPLALERYPRRKQLRGAPTTSACSRRPGWAWMGASHTRNSSDTGDRRMAPHQIYSVELGADSNLSFYTAFFLVSPHHHLAPTPSAGITKCHQLNCLRGNKMCIFTVLSWSPVLMLHDERSSLGCANHLH